MKTPGKVTFRFYEELNDFLSCDRQKQPFDYSFKYNQTVKDAIEAIGVPHTEVDLIIVNGESVGFQYRLQTNDMISVYPVFEAFDIEPLLKLRPVALRKPRFILDVHLGKLSKYLRMLGFDTYYKNDLEDSEIVRMSVSQGRIILTRDIGILKNSQVTHGYWLRSQNPKVQIKEVIRRFDLSKKVKPFNRCTVCNGLVERVEKEEVNSLMEEKTRLYYHEFFQCSACRKIYWEGSHFEKMRQFIESLIKGTV